MSSHHSNKFFITTHTQRADGKLRKTACQEARQASYDDKKAQADRDQLMRLGFCLLWFIGVILVWAYSDILVRILM